MLYYAAQHAALIHSIVKINHTKNGSLSSIQMLHGYEINPNCIAPFGKPVVYRTENDKSGPKPHLPAKRGIILGTSEKIHGNCCQILDIKTSKIVNTIPFNFLNDEFIKKINNNNNTWTINNSSTDTDNLIYLNEEHAI